MGYRSRKISTLILISIFLVSSYRLYSQNLCEQFEGGTFPPTGWIITGSGSSYWMRAGISGFQNGTGSAEFDAWNAPPGTRASLITPVFTATGTGDSLIFDISYVPFPSVPPYNQDSIIILASTNGGTNYISSARLGPLEMMTCNPAQGNCNTPVWQKRKYWLPIGTNKIQFQGVSGFGNDIYLDSICIYHGLVGIGETNQQPVSYSLHQNYPNPFNPVTVITFSVPVSADIRLAVTDAAGKLVAVLIDERVTEGIHNFTYDASGLASGIYFYSISSGTWTESRKMLLIK